MKKSQNQRNDRGITLVALIITIIILVILAAVSISAVYNSKIVDYAVNGATDYAGEAVKENEIMSGTESLIDSTVKKIEDILGGKTPPEPEGPGPQKGLTGEQLKEKIGMYVDYIPANTNPATYSTTQDGEERSGYSEQTITRNTSLKWRIMNANGNKVTLISEIIPTGNLTLRGADGYNNGVKLLNDACNELYKNSSLGVIGRNVKVEDINTLMEYTPSIGTEFTSIGKHYYPNIFIDEKTGYVNGSYGTLLGQSDQSRWYSGRAQATTLRGILTYYTYTLSSYKEASTAEYALATGQTDNTDSIPHTAYWISSRCTAHAPANSYFDFYVFYMDGDRVEARNLYFQTDSTYYGNFALRPCVEIDLTKVNIGETGTGESEYPYSIAAR